MVTVTVLDTYWL